MEEIRKVLHIIFPISIQEFKSFVSPNEVCFAVAFRTLSLLDFMISIVE